jgi:epoxyqueuosine reductase
LFNQSGNNTLFIKAEAARLGFDACGIAQAVQLDDDARRLEAWLGKGFGAGMS